MPHCKVYARSGIYHLPVCTRHQWHVVVNAILMRLHSNLSSLKRSSSIDTVALCPACVQV